MIRIAVGRVHTPVVDMQYLIRVYEDGVTIAYRPWGSDESWGPEAELEERDAR